jgi:hypothetical protein
MLSAEYFIKYLVYVLVQYDHNYIVLRDCYFILQTRQVEKYSGNEWLYLTEMCSDISKY